MKIVILGLSITSSWGNGHATTYRALVRALAARGHSVLFLERDVPWYAAHRDLPSPGYCDVRLYGDLAELEERHAVDLRGADLVVLGSYVPDGASAGDLVLRAAGGVTAFYDIDTPVTLAKLRDGSCEYLAPRQIPHFDLYLSFTGGQTLTQLQRTYGARHARPLYCSVDPDFHYPEPLEEPPAWDLGYLGTYSDDRQPVLERLMLKAARQWAVGTVRRRGAAVSRLRALAANVERIRAPAADSAPALLQPDALHAERHAARHGARRVLAERAAVRGGGLRVPIISDTWPGSILLHARRPRSCGRADARQTLGYLRDLPEADRREIGRCAQGARPAGAHRCTPRAELEACARGRASPRRPAPAPVPRRG
jgi:hypothetical protein